MKKLDGVIIRLSVGIGRNVLEAEEALKIAKKKKHQKKEFNIEIYSDKPISHTLEVPKKVVSAYLRLEKKLSNSKDSLKDLEMLKRDHKTGLLNRFGYYVEKNKLIKQKKYGKNRFIIFFDADSMHSLNNKYGYIFVDKYLTAIGKALNKNIRNRDQKDILNVGETLNNRRNDTAGDEFIIDIYCKEKDVLNITRRYLTKCYEYQRKINKRLKIRN